MYKYIQSYRKVDIFVSLWVCVCVCALYVISFSIFFTTFDTLTLPNKNLFVLCKYAFGVALRGAAAYISEEANIWGWGSSKAGASERKNENVFYINISFVAIIRSMVFAYLYTFVCLSVYLCFSISEIATIHK